MARHARALVPTMGLLLLLSGGASAAGGESTKKGSLPPPQTRVFEGAGTMSSGCSGGANPICFHNVLHLGSVRTPASVSRVTVTATVSFEYELTNGDGGQLRVYYTGDPQNRLFPRYLRLIPSKRTSTSLVWTDHGLAGGGRDIDLTLDNRFMDNDGNNYGRLLLRGLVIVVQVIPTA